MRAMAVLCGVLIGGCGGSTNQGAGDGGGAGGGGSNGPPAFSSTPATTVPEGQVYIYAAVAEDPDADVVRYRKLSGPDGLEVSAGTGAVFWPVPQNAAGDHAFVIEADDGKGHKAQQAAKVTVTRINVPPRIASRAPTAGAIGAAYQYAVRAEDDDGDALTYRLALAPGDMSIDVGGVISFHPGTPGVFRATVEVSDPDGATDRETFAVGVGSGNDKQPPAVAIAAPGARATVEVTTSVTGSVVAADLAGWTLEVCQPVSVAACREIARGLDPIAQGGALGELDPSPFLDGPARLRLTAWDADQNKGIAERDVIIDSAQHLGLFGVEMQDLVTRVDRVRVELGRIYDSRDRGQGDFSTGWTLHSNIAAAPEMMPGQIQMVAPAVLASGYTRFPCGFNCPDDILPPRPIELDVGDSVWIFNFEPVQESWVDRLSVKATYEEPPDAHIAPIYENGQPYYNGYLSAEPENGSVMLRCWEQNDMPYEPPAFHFDVPGKNGRFTVDIAHPSGRVLRMTGTPDLGSPVPPGQPYLTRDGVMGSRGLMVRFERDGKGRIVKIADQVYGGTVGFTYDGDDQLVASTYADNQKATFAYKRGVLVSYSLPDGLGGRTSVDLGAFNVFRNDGTNTKRVNFSIAWEKGLTGRFGDVWSFKAQLASGAYVAQAAACLIAAALASGVLEIGREADGGIGGGLGGVQAVEQVLRRALGVVVDVAAGY